MHMAEREKSSLYPNATWSECIEFVGIIDSFKLKSVAYTEVAKKIGVSTSTKSFTSKISTSKQFGLIITSNKTIQLTDTCKRILYPTENNIYSIKHACFSQPPLYNRLIAIYDGKALPSKDILSNILMSNHNIAKNVKGHAAKCFLDSAEELGLIKGGILCYADSLEKNYNTLQDLDVNDVTPEEKEPEKRINTSETLSIPNESDYITQIVPTQSGKVAKIIIPIDAEEDDLLMVKDMLDIILKRKFKISNI